MNCEAGFSATRASCGSGCRRDTTRPKIRARHYPVFYLNDGQNLFDPATSYIGVDWQADEAADRLIREGRIPPLIIVGIDNAQKDRPREYLPYRSFHPAHHAASGQALSRFSVERSNAFHLSAVPHCPRSGKYGAGRIVSGRDHLPLHCARSPRSIRPFAAGESVLVYLQPAALEIQPRFPAVAGQDLHGDGNQRSGKGRAGSGSLWKMFANWNT